MMNELTDKSAGVQEFITYIENDSKALKHIMSNFRQFNNIEDIKNYIKEADYNDWKELEAELENYKSLNEEGSTTAGVGGYLTPRAFAKKGQKTNAATSTAKKQGMKIASGMPKNSKMLDYKELWPNKKSAMNEDKTEVDVPEDVDDDLKANGFNTLNDLFKLPRSNRENLSDKSKQWIKDVLLPAARRLKEIKKVGGGRRFIPKEFEFPSFLLEPITIGRDEPRKYFKIATNSNGESILMIDPLVKTALDTIERGRSSFSKEQSLSRLTQYLKERVPQQVRGLIKKYSSGGKIMGNGFITLSLIMNKQGDTWFVQNPNKEDNVKDDINVSLYETINEALLNEVSYNKFKKDVSYRSKTEMLHRGIKEVKRKLQEINRIVEYTSRMKQELSEGDGVQYWSRTETQLQQVAEIVNNLNEKIKNLNQ